MVHVYTVLCKKGPTPKHRGKDVHLAVSQGRVLLPLDPQAHGNDHVADLVVLVQRGIVRVVLLRVEDLAPQRQNGLELAVPSLLGAAPCKIWRCLSTSWTRCGETWNVHNGKGGGGTT